jgi:hypothetical protein
MANAYTLRVLNASKGAGSTITTLYGIWVEGMTSGGTNYAIWTDGAGQIRLGDNLFLSNAAGPTLLNEAASATNPTLVPNRADPDTGVGWTLANDLSLVAGGLQAFRVNNSGGTIYTNFVGFISSDTPRTNAAGPNIVNEAASNSNPTLIPNRADPDTGIGWGGTDQLCLISGGAERMRFTLNSITCYELGFAGDVAGSYYLVNQAASATNPTVCPNQADLDSGLGWNSADNPCLVAGGLEAVRAEDPADLATGETSLWLYDEDLGSIQQVTVGADDSGGSGYKLLRIPN